jgi:hypothetical protein
MSTQCEQENIFSPSRRINCRRERDCRQDAGGPYIFAAGDRIAPPEAEIYRICRIFFAVYGFFCIFAQILNK